MRKRRTSKRKGRRKKKKRERERQKQRKKRVQKGWWMQEAVMYRRCNQSAKKVFNSDGCA